MFKTPEDRLSEIQLYELVAEELEQGEQSKGLWAKALAEGEGNIEKAKGLYIKLRVEMIKDEWAYAEKVAVELQKQDEDRRQAEALAAREQKRGWPSSAESQAQKKIGKIWFLVLVIIVFGSLWALGNLI